MITIYHLENSRSERMIWLMEELGQPYELQRFPREAGMMAGEAYRALHPTGKSPIIRDGDTVLIESGAIVQYIVDRYGDGRLSVPVGDPDYARYLQWLHFAEGTAMPQFIMHLFMGGYAPGIDQTSALAVGTKARTTHMLEVIEGELQGRPYFVGSKFTAADIMMIYGLNVAGGFLQLDLSIYPNITAYIARIRARPAYQKGMAIANPAQAA
jgi:glutathione S-transferase